MKQKKQKNTGKQTKRIQKAVKKAKEDWIGTQCEEIEICLNTHNSKRAYHLVGCFGLNGPLRQYFSLYRAVSQREGERKKNDRREKKCPNNPHPHRLQAQKALVLL